MTGAVEGISATDTRYRSGFNKMVQDALGGKIDLIVTKSVSRFARNTVDFLSEKRKANEGEVPQYYVEGSHDAIIDYEKQEVSIMDNQILAHTKYNCTYHIVFIPKYRRKVMYGKTGKEVGRL